MVLRPFCYHNQYYSKTVVFSLANEKEKIARVCILLILFVCFFTQSFSQSCIVNVDSLKGEYVGGCKNGKANGNGIANGVDSYTGNFKDGYPGGYGKYTWRNGSWYEGYWKNGLFDGMGTYHTIDTVKREDSVMVITGYWKKGKYIRRYENPYSVASLSNGVESVSIRNLDSSKSEITIIVKNITAGASDITRLALPKAILTNIQLLQGRFESRYDDESSSTTFNKYILRMVSVPFSAILSFRLPEHRPNTEQVSVSILEPCNCSIQVNLTL